MSRAVARVPFDASYDTQMAIKALNDEIVRLQAQISALRESQQDINVSELERRIAIAAQSGPQMDINDSFRGSGDGHAHGHVPDPGPFVPTVGPENRFLCADGRFLPPEAAPFLIKSDDTTFKHNLNGHLNVAGGIYCSKLTTGELAASLIGARIYSSGNTTYAQGSIYPIPHDLVHFDTSGFFSSANPGRLTVPAGLGGYYLFCGSVGVTTSGSMTTNSVSMRLDGATTLGTNKDYGPTTASVLSAAPMLWPLKEGQYVEMLSIASGSGTATVTANLVYGLWMKRISL